MGRQAGRHRGECIPDVPGPVRTCVGCRRRESDTRLLRVALDPSGESLVVDPRRRAPGRGVWVHREIRCIMTALDRGALTRGLRVTAAVSTDAVTEVLDALRDEHGTTGSGVVRNPEEIQRRNGPDTMSTP